jgi:polysaccharide export outer membrane protein
MHRITRFLLILLGLAFVAFGSTGLADQSESVTSGQSSVSSSEGGAAYRIGPGDSLDVFVWRNPELSTKVTVRPDGMISTPLVEDMLAVGRTPTQLARDMEQVLAKYIKSPTVNIIVIDFQGTPADMIRVVGQAQNPQSLPYREGMTVLDVLIEVGGLGEFAAGNKSKLVRIVDGRKTEIRLRLDDLINDGDIEEDVRVRPGDVIIIPESFF